MREGKAGKLRPRNNAKKVFFSKREIRNLLAVSLRSSLSTERKASVISSLTIWVCVETHLAHFRVVSFDEWKCFVFDYFASIEITVIQRFQRFQRRNYLSRSRIVMSTENIFRFHDRFSYRRTSSWIRVFADDQDLLLSKIQLNAIPQKSSILQFNQINKSIISFSENLGKNQFPKAETIFYFHRIV